MELLAETTSGYAPPVMIEKVLEPGSAKLNPIFP
jgi:hypothetical protein